MAGRILSYQHLIAFRENLILEEKSSATIEKYLRDATGFMKFAAGREITKEISLAYKQELQKKKYAVRSINSMLASVNSLFVFLEWTDCKVKALRCQRHRPIALKNRSCQKQNMSVFWRHPGVRNSCIWYFRRFAVPVSVYLN